MKASCCEQPGTDLTTEAPEIGPTLRLCLFLKQHRAVAIGLATLCCLALLRIQFSINLVVGESMWPTFVTGDLLLTSKRAYLRDEPRRGDIVVARDRGELIVKRVVGLPGEEVQVQKGDLYVDGTLLAENHPIKRGNLDIGKGKLRAGKFALLGDNRDLLSSQMVHAVVSKNQIAGKVVFSTRLWPQKGRKASHGSPARSGVKLTGHS